MLGNWASSAFQLHGEGLSFMKSDIHLGIPISYHLTGRLRPGLLIGLMPLVLIIAFSSMAYPQEFDPAGNDDIFFCNWVTYDTSKHQNALGILSFVMDYKLSKGLAYEFRLMLFRYIRFHETDKAYVSATPLVWLGLIALPAYYMAIFGEKEWMMRYLIPGFIVPFGSHLVATPKVGFHMFAGIIPDVILFTGDNGLLLQPQAGIRLYKQPGVTISLKAVYRIPLIFDQYTQSSLGIGIEIGYNFYDESPIW